MTDPLESPLTDDPSKQPSALVLRQPLTCTRFCLLLPGWLYFLYDPLVTPVPSLASSTFHSCFHYRCSPKGRLQNPRVVPHRGLNNLTRTSTLAAFFSFVVCVTCFIGLLLDRATIGPHFQNWQFHKPKLGTTITNQDSFHLSSADRLSDSCEPFRHCTGPPLSWITLCSVLC